MNMPIKMVKDLENLPSYLCLNASQDQSSQTQPPVYLTPESDGNQNHMALLGGSCSFNPVKISQLANIIIPWLKYMLIDNPHATIS